MSTLSDSEVNSKKLAAGLLAIFLGGLGIHKFVLGYTTSGVIMLVIWLGVGIFTCGMSTGVISIIAFVEGIIYLTKSDQEFREIYIDGVREWF